VRIVDDRTPPNEVPVARRGKRAVIAITVLGATIIVGGLAATEFASRGASGVSGIAVADYRAQAQPDEGPAPAFELPSVAGDGTISLEAYRGKVVVLNFWASWCTPCWREAPGLQQTWKRYRSRGIQFVGVNERDDLYAARSFVEQNGLTFPSASDPPGRLAFSYEITGMPTTLLIDRNGRLLYRFLGYLDERTLRPALDDVLEEPA
jgi:peroxiredoxin